MLCTKTEAWHMRERHAGGRDVGATACYLPFSRVCSHLFFYQRGDPWRHEHLRGLRPCEQELAGFKKPDTLDVFSLAIMYICLRLFLLLFPQYKVVLPYLPVKKTWYNGGMIYKPKSRAFFVRKHIEYQGEFLSPFFLLVSEG